MTNNDFAAFILTHGRAEKVITYKTLREQGYTGRIVIVIDDEDKQGNLYREKFGDAVQVFSKDEISKKFDSMDTSNDRRCIVYARNACFDIAEKLNIKYFIQLDDDYTRFEMRKASGNKLLTSKIKNMDLLFEKMVQFYEDSGCLTVAMAQGGDFIGGVNGGNFKKGICRKAMNSFVCKTDNRFNFIGRVNEDVNTYTYLGSQGKKIFTITDVNLCQVATQQSAGGMSEMYLDSGTYLKSFYSVMIMPSSVKISTMGNTMMRIHHSIKWNNTVPMIISDKYRKERNENG